MSLIWEALFSNVALVTILIVAWDFVSDWTGRLPRAVLALAFGAVMGLGAMASMVLAQTIIPGFIFDLRAPLIAAAGFFGGPIAAIVASLVAIACRLYLGGQGAIVGVIGILLLGAVGVIAYYTIRRRAQGLRMILYFSLAVTLGVFINFLVLPVDVWMALLKRIGLPLFTLVFVSAMIIGFLLYRLMRRQELTTANFIYRSMVDEMPDPMSVKDPDGRILVANPATAALFRTDSAEGMIGRLDSEFLPPKAIEEIRQHERAAMEAGEVRRFENPNRFEDDDRGAWLSTMKAPLRDMSGRIIGVITHNRDVTEIRRANMMRDEFISTVSHELRTPLTSIRGSLGLIVSGVAGELPPKAANLVKIAHTNSERLVALINDILDIEKIEAGKMAFDIRKEPLRPIVESVVTASAAFMPERNVAIVLHDDAPGAEVMVDPDRMHQVLSNLLSNAVKYSPQNDKVTVRISRNDGYVRLSVSDRGAGIPEAFRKRIFGKFEQADASSTRQVGGTGLGLSIVKSIVDRLAGRVSFETETDERAGSGTTFHVDLPEVSSARAQQEDEVAGEDIEAGTGPRHRVLVCEDDGDVARVIQSMLVTEGFTSDVAATVADARKALAERDYVALTLDIKLAGESGLDIFEHLRAAKRNSNIPVIVVSVVADETRRSLNGAAVGIVDWIQKPVAPDRLRRALSAHLRPDSNAAHRVLHVEDDSGVQEMLAGILGESVSVAYAQSLAEARAATARERFDVVILDVALPDGSGIELLDGLPPETAVIVFTASDLDADLAAKVDAVLTKTKTSELDVARMVRRFLPGGDLGRNNPTNQEKGAE